MTELWADTGREAVSREQTPFVTYVTRRESKQALPPLRKGWSTV